MLEDSFFDGWIFYLHIIIDTTLKILEDKTFSSTNGDFRELWMIL